jgi:putative protease
MTSRQCLFHQVTGCGKTEIDEACMPHCEKSASITNLKEETFIVEKSKGNYHRIYNNINYLNTEVITDFPELFSGFLIDLRDIKTETKMETDKPGVIRIFEDLVSGNSEKEPDQVIYPTSNSQYRKGI